MKTQFSPQMVLVVVWILNTCILDFHVVSYLYMEWMPGTKISCVFQYLSCFQRGISYSAMKSFNGLPSNIKNLRNNREQFKIIPLKYLISHSFYSFIEFFEHHTNNTHNWYFKFLVCIIFDMFHTLWQTWCRLELGFKEQICFITSNNQQSAYAIHIPHSAHEYGLMETTMNALITFCTEK
jgi:hypothetical protein